ncbi:glycerophosphodiester phosphodiesterase [Solirubrobacter taibaiensis]|nr:glycerophosphodiester phosphodiesterase [Solirubrobacter taibaiensis]
MHSRVLASAIAGALVVGLAVPAAEARRTAGSVRGEPIVIAHRGASAYRPEHTLAAYRLAIDMGADFIEPDLVSTKDRVLVDRHENEISGTTDVATRPEFANRRTTKVVDGVSLTGWFTEDFTLAELKTLRAIERIPQLRPSNTAFNGLYQVPTLQEVIDLAKREGVGIYPETKHSTYFSSIGLSLEEPLVRTLRANGLDRRNADVFVQSFEVSNLQALSRQIHVPLVQLTSATGRPYDFTAKGDPRTYADLTTPSGLRGIARYADGLGPEKSQIVPRDAQNRLLAPTSLVNDAHRAGLLVHPYTFRPENEFLAADHREGDPASPEFPRARGNQPAELKLFFKLGVDGVFADNPDTAVAVRRKVFGRR